MPTVSSSSRTRAAASGPSRAVQLHGLGDLVADAPDGSNAFIAPWKTIAMSFQRWGTTVSSPRSSMSAPSKSSRPETDAVGGSSPMSARIVVVFPHPDSPTMPSLVRLDGEGHALERVRSGRSAGRTRRGGRRPRGAQGYHDACRRSDGRSTRKRDGQVTGAQTRVERILHRLADDGAREDDEHHAEARRDHRPPGLVDYRVVRERVLDKPPPGIAVGTPRPRNLMNVSAKIA